MSLSLIKEYFFTLVISFFLSFLVHRSLCVLVLKLYYQILEYTILILFVLCKSNNFRISGLYVLTSLSVSLAVVNIYIKKMN